jgi:hypothetical protein
MSLFALHQRVIEEYAQFVHAYVQIADPRVRAYTEQVLRDERALWPAPMLQLSPAYQYGVTLDALVQQGVLHPETGRIFRTRTGEPLRLYAHQERALRLAHQGQSYVVTSGTGSGKSYTYLIPIIDYLLRHPEARGHVVALILYPMNALVNSQLRALESLREQYEQRYGQRFPITFAKYTGETLREQREQMRQQPPQILLTNYMMGELLMVRREDQPLFGQRALRFLVFDELHTYRGRQGADVAMLVRRLKERYGAPDLRHIGTSATMVASEDATHAERRQAVAQFAASFFGHPFDADSVVDEALAPATEGGAPTDAELRAVWGQPFPDTLDDLRRHPLARWIEWTFGLERDAAGNLRRRTPRTLREACEPLAQQLELTPDACEQWVQRFLDHLERVRRADGAPLFAFKLHQFISQSRPLHATLEPPDRRKFSLVALSADESGAPYIPLYFCRHCGQDYYRVARDDHEGVLVGASLDESPNDAEATLGYLTFAEWDMEQIPDEWYDASGRLKRDWRERVPQRVWVSADGVWSAHEREGACAMWWQPAPFALCLRCGEWYDRRVSERTKLVGLSSEGRSSATTVLALAQLRHAEPTGGARPKLLTFTDNRQDASLQAGHFNDFVRIALLRAALVAALEQHERLRYHEVAARVVDHSGLTLRDIASQPDLAPNTPAANRVWATFRDLTEYRLYEDLRREWRYTQPNLETLGLLRIEYEGLRALCDDESAWACLEPFARLTPDAREGILRAVLDLFRYKFALNADSLKADKLRELSKRCTQELNEHWGIDPDADDLIEARVLVLARVDERLPAPVGALLSARSKIGRYLCQRLGIRADEYDALIPQLLQQLTAYGLLARVQGAVPMYQLNVASLVWCRGDGTPQVSTLTARGTAAPQVNPFFVELYRAQPSQLARLEAREHTAQVVERGERERRERRFSGVSEERPLPYLVCSPTMELGIDIADLDLVHLRNVPPTPANYAQRSGRAGRQGQPGLIVTYCGAQHAHDQYFFARPAEMVAGVVRAPRLDLGSESLLRAHLHALWLNEIGLPLGKSIEQVIDIEQYPNLPLRAEVCEQIHRLTDAAKERLRTRYQQVIATLPERPRWLTDEWLQRAIAEIPERFDRAFDRWRELYRAVEEQMSRAERLRRSARDRDTQDSARRAYEEAERQRNLLLQIGVEYEESDFYPYRYLASEGFLPGYNFPTLPLRAWAPRKEGEFIARPRSLALREFAPHSVVYHEGSKWEVWTLMTPLGGIQQRVSLKKLCAHCDAYAENDHDVCPVCQQPLDASNSQWVQVFEMCNVKLRRRERIHSGEEERLRKGYHMTLHYQPLPAGEPPLEADVWIGDQKVFRLTAQMVSLMHLNHGWRSRGAEGFLIDGDTGEFVSESASERESRAAAQRTHHPMRVRLMTHGVYPVLFLRPYDRALTDDPEWRASFQYALLRGIEQSFQLEPGELQAHWMGVGEQTRLMLVESVEASTGILQRLLDEPDAFERAARSALQICHFDLQGNDLYPECTRACYRCLLSYDAQPDARALNRHRIKATLQDLTRSRVLPRYGERDWREHLEWLMQHTDPRSPLERSVLETLGRHHLRLPDFAQYRIESPACVADFFYSPRTCVFCDGAVHQQPATQQRDDALRTALREAGYRVVVIDTQRPIEAQLQQHCEIFGDLR